MKLSLYAATLLLGTSLIQGCGGGGNDTKQDPPKKKSTTSTTSDSGSGSGIVDTLLGLISSEGSTTTQTAKVVLENELDSLVTQYGNDVDGFAKAGTKTVVEYVVTEYFSYIPYAEDYLLAGDWGPNNDQQLYEVLYAQSDVLKGYMKDLYEQIKSGAKNLFNAPSYQRAPTARAVANGESKTLIELIIDEILTMITNLLPDYFNFFGDVTVQPVATDNSPKIDPHQSFTFKDTDIKAKKYFVASQQYMSVAFKDDGLSGYGDIGYGIGADFNSSISGGKLFIDMDGVYEVDMKYKDPGYCMATEMTDTSNGSKYPAFWFTNSSDYDKATNLTTAESLCYIHSTEYKTKVIAKDGVLEKIADVRVGNLPVATDTTSNMVDELIAGVNNSAVVKDAKYFARKMRHGIFAIYTTNGQIHTLQATETEKVTRDLLPLAASSAIAIDDMITGAYDSSVAFQAEVNTDLNNSISDINARVNALITATSQAMDRTTSANNYHGVSDKTIYGDTVDFEAKNKNISLFSNTAKADVVIKIMSDGSAGRTANVEFVTKVTTTVFGNSDVKFSEIDATSSSSYIGGSDYNLNIKSMKYTRADGLMQLTGDGYLGSASKLTLDSYKVLATFQEKPAIKLLKFSVEADGDISTPSGRTFSGTLVFDGDNTNNSQMNGTLVGINDEPTIKGAIKTSLSSSDITAWVSSHDTVSASDAGDLNNIGNQSYSMDVAITKDNKTVSADMLVKRDDSVQTWTYIMKNIAVVDTKLKMTVDSLYFIQEGDNTLVQTFEKLAKNGVSVNSDMNTLINVGWDVASDFSQIGIEGLQVKMQPDSGDVAIKATVNVHNNTATSKMSADLNSSYDYATTHLTSIGNFNTLVSTDSNGSNVYKNDFATSGVIKVDNKYDYNYQIAYTDAVQDMLFTSNASNYQMGFRMTDTLISGGDSYGVKATFTMNNTHDVLEKMILKNINNEELGIYDRSFDPLKIKFTDGVEEYMYLY